MSTIGSLLLAMDPGIRPWSQGMQDVNREQIGRQQAQTGLIELQQLKEKQAAEAEFMRAAQTDPRVQALLFGGGGSILGSLGPAGGPPGAGGMPPPGPITQGSLGPGGVGGTQTIPASPDASQFAGVSPQGGGPIPPDMAAQVMPTVTPPQSVLGSLGPAGQPQGQPQQNPVLAMAAQNPRAAMMLQGQMQAQQDQQMKNMTTQLTIREKTADAVASSLQGVNSQESYEPVRQDIARFAPQIAARLPQIWSKEAVQPFIESALSAKDKATLGIQTTSAQAELMKARMSGRVATTDQYLKALGVTPGTEQPGDMEKAIAWQQRDEVARQAAHGTGQIVMTPGGAIRVGKDNQVEVIKGPDGKPIYDKPTAATEAAASYGDRAARAHEKAVALEDKGLTPSLWSKVGEALPFGLGNYLVGDDQQSYRQAVSQFGGALLRKESGMAISQTEYDMIEKTFFPQPGNSKKLIEDKRREREAIIKNLQEEGKGAGRTGTQTHPHGQAPATAGKPVSQMSAEETRAEIAAIKARGGS